MTGLCQTWLLHVVGSNVQFRGPGQGSPDQPGVGLGQPLPKLGVEVLRRGEGASGQERGLQELVGPLHGSLGLRVVGLNLRGPGREDPREGTDSGSTALIPESCGARI